MGIRDCQQRVSLVPLAGSHFEFQMEHNGSIHNSQHSIRHVVVYMYSESDPSFLLAG
jgi:hypothetical protein